jgi:hypothetical protein
MNLSSIISTADDGAGESRLLRASALILPDEASAAPKSTGWNDSVGRKLRVGQGEDVGVADAVGYGVRDGHGVIDGYGECDASRAILYFMFPNCSSLLLPIKRDQLPIYTHFPCFPP